MACTVSNGQSIGRVRADLKPEIQVTETPDAERIISYFDSQPRQPKVTMYAVRLFSDNSQSARASAHSAANRFENLMEGIEPRVTYEIPYFRVTAGRFIDRTDAVALCGKVLGAFPKAFVVEEEVTIN